MDVPQERIFSGLDGYKQVIENSDLVILTTPPGFRPYHFEAAINAGKHVFMEKPVAADVPGVRKVLEMAQVADEKNLKVVVGLQRRYQNCYLAALKEVKENGIVDYVKPGEKVKTSAELKKEGKPPAKPPIVKPPKPKDDGGIGAVGDGKVKP